ncbi:GntR family transcriptional regulator [Rossellomorea vietnamensis]|uniref:GntR family transcriptional regulator n=1 Tax=Rossellomorea vietnamensis TaxID=218284 RepID=A0A5D4MAD6_9BACI|nr:GntR family transcriptional regulator [Rossellomorea vietnamensis]TYR98596.1 GntR family transcriptional regulator [Rossellomorea vietnamensis]
MILNSDSIKPIYIQIAEWLETEILGGSIEEDAKVHSQYQLAEMLNINPATAAKGLNLLADDGILYKKRGLGMFVSTEAKSIILSKRKNQTLARLVEELVKEAEHLHVGEDELVEMIKYTKSRLKGEGK